MLRAPRIPTSTKVSTVGGVAAGTCRSATTVTISPCGKTQLTFVVRAFILKALTKYASRARKLMSDWKHLANLPLADRNPTGTAPIDLIVGADLFSEIILSGVRRGSKGQPIAQQSHFGWLVSGPFSTPPSLPREIKVFHYSLEQEIRRFWEIEEIPHSPILSPAELRCENHFLATHSRAPNGRYIVRLPFRAEAPIKIGES